MAPSPPSVVADPPRPDDDVAGALLDRPVDQLTGAGGRRQHRVVALGAAGQAKPAGAGHLDDGRTTFEAPRRLDGRAERTGDDRRAVGATEHVEQPLAAVGHRRLVAVVAELPAGVADGGRGLVRGRRAAELVEGDEHPHDGSP